MSKETFSLKIQKKKPATAAKKYVIPTMKELFIVAKSLNEEDRRKLMSELSDGIEVAVQLHKVTDSMQKESQIKPKADFDLETFTWWND